MIKIYVSPSCSSCRKVKKWFNEQNIPYEEKNIFSSSLNKEELKSILVKSENGAEDIIATKSKIIKEKNIDIDSMSVSQMIDFIRENPSVLRRPIVVDSDSDKMQVGYNPDDIGIFIPKARRAIEMICYANDCIEKEEKEKKTKK